MNCWMSGADSFHSTAARHPDSDPVIGVEVGESGRGEGATALCSCRLAARLRASPRGPINPRSTFLSPFLACFYRRCHKLILGISSPALISFRDFLGYLLFLIVGLLQLNNYLQVIKLNSN